MDDSQWKADVIAAERFVDQCEITVARQKEILKADKESYENAVHSLRTMIHPDPQAALEFPGDGDDAE